MKNHGLSSAHRSMFMGIRRALLSLLRLLDNALGMDSPSAGSREKRRARRFRAFTGEKEGGAEDEKDDPKNKSNKNEKEIV